MNPYALLRPLLFALDAEPAHDLTLAALDRMHAAGLLPWLGPSVPSLPVRLLGLEFPNPVGLAAGLDKNGAHVDALAALGFGFIEVGTVTPRPQSGNPKPRMWRLPAHQAVINRLGFNNAGVDVLCRNLERTRYRGVLGINIGKNKDTPNERAAEDYLRCLERVYPYASYVTVNVSSPNTAGLRDLQSGPELKALLGALREARDALGARHGRSVPLLVKIAPDLDEAALDAIARAVLDRGIEGVICTNTTITRPGLESDPRAQESGGLSGAPLFQASTRILHAMQKRLGDRLPLIGVGGILRGADACAKFDAGARLVQCYSGLVFRGPALIGECVQALAARSGR